MVRSGHSLWGVWVEIFDLQKYRRKTLCHSLWGVWVEIDLGGQVDEYLKVTPFGECGLKYLCCCVGKKAIRSLPLGSVG